MQEPIDHRINNINVTQNEFCTGQIHFTPTIVEFLRNSLVYKKLKYSEIEQVEFITGYLIKHQWIMRILCISIIILLIRWIIYGMEHTSNLNNTNVAFWFNKGSIISVWGPIILIIGVLIAFFQSFQRSTVIIIKTQKLTKSISIRELDKSGDIEPLSAFLHSKDIVVFDNRMR